MISSSLSLVSRSASLWIILIRVASGPHALALRCPSYELIAVRTPAPPHPPHRPHLFCTPPVPPAPPATFRIQDSHKFSHSREISRFETCRNIAHPAPRTPRCFIGTSQTTESFNFSPTTKMREKNATFPGLRPRHTCAVRAHQARRYAPQTRRRRARGVQLPPAGHAT